MGHVIHRRETAMAQDDFRNWNDRDAWSRGGFADGEARKAASDAARVSGGFWPLLRKVAARIPFAEDAVAAYYCAFDRETPMRARATLFGALAYFVLPFDLAPDLLPIIGFTDDAAVLALALRTVFAHIKPEHREAARRALTEDDDVSDARAT
jgi:uncharacterized membrane protein YkvA (DUF1232 family)